MVIRMLVRATLGLAVLTGCETGFGERVSGTTHYLAYGDQLAPDSRVTDSRLIPVLGSAEDTPERQGLLYVAMAEAQVAAQYAGQALTAPDLAAAQGAIGHVLYAIDPAVAPGWQARSAGIVELWAGKGYGVRRAVRGIQDQVRDLAAGAASGDPAADHVPQVIACTDNTLARADRVVDLGQQVLGATSDADLRPVLEQIERVTRELYYGAAGPEGDSPQRAGCGLNGARLFLWAMIPAAARA